MDLPAHFWSRRSDSNRGRRSPRPPSAYSSRATAQHTWGSPQVQVFQQECQRSRMLHKHFEGNWTSRLPPRGDYSPRSLARQLAPTPVDTLALAAPFTNLGELTLPRSPLRSSVRPAKIRKCRSGPHYRPLRHFLEPAIGLEPMTCALRVRCSTTELRRPGQKNCIRPATFRVIASGVLHRMVQGEAKQSRVVYDCFGPSGLAMTE